MTSLPSLSRARSFLDRSVRGSWAIVSRRALVACALLGSVTLSPGAAHAATLSSPCQVTKVVLQGRIAAIPSNDLLLIECTDPVNGTLSYVSYISSTPNQQCNSSADAVKGWESMALSASLSGRPLSIWWTTVTNTCPGNSNARVINSITF
jgi:hypothetical protein